MLWRLAPMIYGPTVLFALGEGAVVPLLPVIAAQLGADVPTAALVASALVVGQLCGNIPAGWAVSRIGERMTMIVGGVLALGGVAGMLFAPSLPVLGAAVFLIGFCAAAFGLARHSFMTTRVPIAYRARALSLLGGTFRLGMFVGPFLAAALIAIFGDENSTVWFFGACLLATIALLVFGPDPEDAVPVPRVRRSSGDSRLAEDTGEPVTGSIPVPERVGVFRTMWRFRGVLSRLGLAAASLSAVRSARQVVLPLWGVSIGSSGILLTLGADVAPQDDPAAFLGSWRTLTDAGGAIAPLLVSAVAAVVSLSVATGVIGVIGLAGAAGFIRWVPRFVPRTR